MTTEILATPQEELRTMATLLWSTENINRMALTREIDDRLDAMIAATRTRVHEFIQSRYELRWALFEADLKLSDVAALGVVTLDRIHGYPALWHLFAIGDASVLNRDQAKLVASRIQVLDNDSIVLLAKQYGRNPNRITAGASKKEVLRWLLRDHSHHLFKTAGIRIMNHIEAYPDSRYGKVMVEMEARMTAVNANGHYAKKAEGLMARPDKEACRDEYAAGKLPPQQIHRKAVRWAARQLLQDFWCEYKKSLQSSVPSL